MSLRWIAFLSFLAGLMLLLVFDRLAKIRRPHGDRGDYWTRVLFWSLALGGPVVLFTSMLELVPQLWKSGWHPYFDLTNAFDLSPWWRALLTLALAYISWLLVLAFFLLGTPHDPLESRWLAGSIGDGDSRLWVLLFTLPLLLLLIFQSDELGRGAAGYPAFLWAALATVVLTLIAVAFSSGKKPLQPQPASVPPPPQSSPRPPWVESLRQQGIDIETLTQLQPHHHLHRQPSSSAARDLAHELHRMGARGIAPALVEAIVDLVSPWVDKTPDKSARLVFAPDDSGQEECIALASSLLQRRFQATTLVITSSRAGRLDERLTRWLPSPDMVQNLGMVSSPSTSARLWVVDAETLSDRLLEKLQSQSMVSRIGLVVWWHLEQFTGVLAANLWAISRRLHRLLSSQGRHDLRTLALMRSALHGGAQPSDFVRRLLPHPFPPSSVVHVEPERKHTIQIHAIHDVSAHFDRRAEHLASNLRHPLLVATQVSAEIGWETHLQPARDLADLTEALQNHTRNATLGGLLEPTAATAGARLLAVESGDVLSLLEIVEQGGRSIENLREHHVGLIVQNNPYIAHLLRQLVPTEDIPQIGFDASRRLVGAEAHPSIFKRHLILALNELPDTRDGLLKNFLWNEDIVRETLDEISHESKLDQKEVRFLDKSGRLRIDYQYTSQRLPDGERRPLDTVGSDLLVVRDPGARERRRYPPADRSGTPHRGRLPPSRLRIRREALSHQGMELSRNGFTAGLDRMPA